MADIEKRQERLKTAYERNIAAKATKIEELEEEITMHQRAIVKARDLAIKLDLEKKGLLEDYHEFLETLK